MAPEPVPAPASGDDAVWLSLMWLASPALPVGGFSYSEALEAAVESGRVVDEAGARDWLLNQMALGPARAPGEWRPPIVKTIAEREGGVAELVEAVDKHREWLAKDGRLTARRIRRAAVEIEAIAAAQLRARLANVRHGATLADLAARVVAGTLDPYRAADDLTTTMTTS